MTDRPPTPATADPGLEGLRARLEARLAPDGVRVAAVAPLAGGACQDLFRVDALVGGAPRRLVLRSDAPRPLPGSVGRGVERRVVEAAAAAGVRTPAPRWSCPDVVRPGAEAWLMEWVEGEALGRRVVSHPSLLRARERFAADVARELAAIHALTPAASPGLLEVLGRPPADPLAARVAELRALADAQPAPRPAVELALAWLGAQAAPREVGLVHGDLRVGNLLLGPEGLAAVLDWEFARWSSPLEDLAWLCVRDWRFGSLALAAGGVATRAALLDAYAAASGRAVDRAALRAWEVAGNLRWALGCVEQGRRYASGERQDVELLAIARRAPEMEWEALRLIDEVEGGARGPEGEAPEASAHVGGDEALALAALARFVERDLRPALGDAGLAFRARVAAGLLQSLARERPAARALARGEVRGLAGLLPDVAAGLGPAAGGEGDEVAREAARLALARALRERARSGALDRAAQARARAAVRAALAARLRVTTPDFELGERIE